MLRLSNIFQELMTTTRAVFGPAITPTLVFETSDLDVCRDVAVEIHPAAWEAISLTVSTVVVKKKDSASSRGECLFPNSRTRVLIMSRRRRRRNCGPTTPAYGP
jgi:hypothetical protein